MTDDPKGWNSRGYLPHFDSPELTQHVVFRIAGSLPLDVIDSLPGDASRRRVAVDAYLDRTAKGAPLGDPALAAIVEGALLHFDGERYRLVAWCVMPNHVHVLFEQMPGWPLAKVVKAWKTFSAKAINKRKARSGPFWAMDYFDRFIRGESHLWKTIDYIEGNPVRAGLIGSARLWRFSSAFSAPERSLDESRGRKGADGDVRGPDA